MKPLITWFRSHLDRLLGKDHVVARSPRSSRRSGRRRSCRPAVERLEERTLLAVSWDGGGGDYSWLNPLNWSGDRLPDAGDDVEIRNVPQQYAVVLNQAAEGTAVRSLFSEARLEVRGSLSIAAASEVAGALALANGTIQLQAGANLVLRGGGTLTGTVDVAAGATVSFEDRAYVWYGGTIAGAGWARVTSYTALEGTNTARNVQLTVGADLVGPGTLTIARALRWDGGRLLGIIGEDAGEDGGSTRVGPGTVVIESSAQLQLPGDGLRKLAGVKVQNYGSTVWDTEGKITRPSTEEEFTNAASLRAASSASFHAGAAAAKLYRAMFGGFTGAGTDEAAIYKVLEGKTAAQIQAIRDAYQDHYHRNLDTDLESELYRDELTRAQKLLAGDRAAADAAGLHHAIARVGTNEALIFEILEGKTLEQLQAIAQQYESAYGESLEQALRGDLSGAELDRALALLAGNQVLADAARLRDAMAGLGTDEAAIYKVLEGKTPDQIDAIKRQYEQQYGETLEQALRGDLSGDELNRALALLRGDRAEADAYALHNAMDGPGTDEEAAWGVLEGKTSEKRAAIAQAYRSLFGRELKDDIDSDFSDSAFSGAELSKTRALLYRGGLSDAERLYFAIKGLGTDEETIREVLADRSLAEINAIKAKYEELSGGETLDDAISGDLSGRDYFDAKENLKGRPTTPQEKLERLKALHEFERGGGWNWTSKNLMDVLGGDGGRLDGAVERAQAFYDEVDGNWTEENQRRLDELLGYAKEDVTTYREAKDGAADTVGTVLSTAAAVIVIVATNGAGTPLVVTVLSAATAGGTVKLAGRFLIQGQGYDWEEAPADWVTGGADGVVAALTSGTGANSVSWVGRVLRGAWQGARMGAAGGAVSSIVARAMQDGTWDHGFWEGLAELVQAGGFGALEGGISGGLFEGLFHAFPNCFPAGTLVATEQGPRAIETIQAGDRVWSYDFRSSQWVLRKVVRPLTHQYRGEFVTIGVAGQEVRSTADHPFWVIEGESLGKRPEPAHVPAAEPGNDTTPGRWVDARDLRLGDLLLLREGKPARVDALAIRTEGLDVYNLTVAGLHTYAVGQGGILVHNRGMPTEGRGGSWIDPATGQSTRVDAAGNPSARGRSGTWRSTDPDVLAAETRPGQPAPREVVVVYRDGSPDFSPYLREIGEVPGEVKITFDRDPTIARNSRHGRDLVAADEKYAQLLSERGIVNPETGRAWTAAEITRYRDLNNLTWHHHEDMTTMQLVSEALNDKCYHDGGRGLLDRLLGLPRLSPKRGS